MHLWLGTIAIICCLILSTYNVFLDSAINNVALWGVVVSIIYMLLATVEKKKKFLNLRL